MKTKQIQPDVLYFDKNVFIELNTALKNTCKLTMFSNESIIIEEKGNHSVITIQPTDMRFLATFFIEFGKLIHYSNSVNSKS